jgi:signal transduction histidine kinase
VTIRFTPENTEGYTLVKCDYDDPENSPLASGLAGGYEGVDSDADYELRQESLVPPYEKYYATAWEPIPFTTVYKDKLDQAIFEIIIVSFFVAFIPATISYNIKLRRYQIFEYRRQMVDAMAHDLKTPMAAITAYAENLSNHIGTDKQEYYAGKIEEKVTEMNGMVNGILEFSRSEDTNLKINKEEIDVGGVIEKIISDNETTVNARSLKVNYDGNSKAIKTDRELFTQALANLISNAVIHCKEGTEVDISCAKDRITIANITEEKITKTGDLKKAFVKGSSSRGSKGNGLGLAIADNNLVMLGYKLDLKTEEDRFIAIIRL